MSEEEVLEIPYRILEADKNQEMNSQNSKILSKRLSRDDEEGESSLPKKKKMDGSMNISDDCGHHNEHSHLLIDPIDENIQTLKVHIPDEVLKSTCIGYQRVKELRSKMMNLDDELAVSLNEWNMDFGKMKYFRDKYEHKYNAKSKEVIILENQLKGCRTELLNMTTSLVFKGQELDDIWKKLVEAEMKIWEGVQNFKALEVEKKALESENKRLQAQLLEKEITLSEAKIKAEATSSKAIEDFKKSLACKSMIQEHIEKAHDHIVDAKVRFLERQSFEEGLIRGFFKGIRLVHRTSGADIKGLSPSQASNNSSLNMDDDAESDPTSNDNSVGDANDI